jgi:hypothetical protein
MVKEFNGEALLDLSTVAIFSLLVRDLSRPDQPKFICWENGIQLYAK